MKARSIMTKMKMLELGIVPAFTGNDLSEMLSSLSDKERRKVTRKFRKVWRKMLKEEDESMLDLIFTKSGSSPTISQKRNRSVLVLQKIIGDIENEH